MISKLKKALRRRRSGGVVLMYHRIATPDSDPWDLCVSPERFDRHIAMLRENFHIIPMHRLASRIAEGESTNNLVAITFDDGYADNFEWAVPVLKKHNVPATFFLTTGNESQRGYWWDELEDLILRSHTLPATINLQVGQKAISMILGDCVELTEEALKQNKDWRYGQEYPNPRIKLYVELWSELKYMRPTEQRDAMAAIRAWAGISFAKTPPIMNREQILEVARTGLFEIGAHSVNHPALGTLTKNEQLHEVTHSRDVLENIVNLPVWGFAYPYGDYNDQTPSITRHAGFKYALTTAGKPVSSARSVFEIPRFQVTDITDSELRTYLAQWQTI